MHASASVLTAWLLAGVFAVSQPAGQQAASYDRARDNHGFHVFIQNGGWCWFQDLRAVIRGHYLFAGSVQGNGTGPVIVGVYDLKRGKAIGRVVMRDRFDHDDHNAPALYVRPDGSVLAVYARHHRDKLHYYRISAPDNPLRWSDERKYEHRYPLADKVTYMNLVYLSQPNRLYNFFRGIEFNPTVIESSDHGATWGNPTHFIKSELEGRHRPYARYATNGTDTVHVCFTDGHPDRFGNSIYYAAFRDGKFFRAAGEMIKDLRTDGPLRPSEADLVFRGSGKWAPPGPASAEHSAWTSSIAIDSHGYPHIAYSVHLTNEDHRYRIATWNGKRWLDREVAFAGRCLYATQTSYTGLITLDPSDPSFVAISTSVNPSTGAPAGNRHEIYRATVRASDSVQTIDWQPITGQSPYTNIRPVIARGGGRRVLMWLRGDYRSYTNYDLDVVGIVESP